MFSSPFYNQSLQYCQVHKTPYIFVEWMIDCRNEIMKENGASKEGCEDWKDLRAELSTPPSMKAQKKSQTDRGNGERVAHWESRKWNLLKCSKEIQKDIGFKGIIWLWNPEAITDLDENSYGIVVKAEDIMQWFEEWMAW